jgi:GTP-binding protein
MAKYVFKNPRFETSAVKSKDYPILRSLSGKELPEVAVAGRSNVGKSSLLNDLFLQKGLVKTSSVPGKTQMLNFFTLDGKLAFVDLPGYGYAQVPISVRKRWGPMVQEYLEKRLQLKVILLLFDIRRIPNDEDKEFLGWAAHHNKAVILVLTKVDKVKLNEKKANTSKILEAFNCGNLHYIHYSTTKNVGRKELIAILTDALHDEIGQNEESS